MGFQGLSNLLIGEACSCVTKLEEKKVNTTVATVDKNHCISPLVQINCVLNSHFAKQGQVKIKVFNCLNEKNGMVSGGLNQLIAQFSSVLLNINNLLLELVSCSSKYYPSHSKLQAGRGWHEQVK